MGKNPFWWSVSTSQKILFNSHNIGIKYISLKYKHNEVRIKKAFHPIAAYAARQKKWRHLPENHSLIHILAIPIQICYWDGKMLEMVFCYQNCSDLLWEKLLKFEAEGQEFTKSLRSLEQFIQTVKGQNNFW